MKLFLDSADLEEIRAAGASGLVDGVTMNAKLLAEVPEPLEELAPAACALVRGPVCVPAQGKTPAELVESARALAGRHERLVLKLPLHAAGIQALQELQGTGIRTHATQCLKAEQALLAAQSGACFVSPFLGRMEELGGSGLQLLADILEERFATQVMAASVRSTAHVQAAASLGTHACTLSWRLLQSLAAAPAATTRQGRRDA